MSTDDDRGVGLRAWREAIEAGLIRRSVLVPGDCAAIEAALIRDSHHDAEHDRFVAECWKAIVGRLLDMKITKDSHLDHSLTPAHVAFLVEALLAFVEEFGAVEEFTLRTITLPRELPSLPCALHGPLVGDDPVPDSECVLRVRGGRPGASRLCPRPSRPSRLMTVIVGPHEGETILYTAFGGPAAPREPHELPHGSDAYVESLAFWAQHALSED